MDRQPKLTTYHLSKSRFGMFAVTPYQTMINQAGVPLPNYNRIWGYSVGGSFGWNFLRLFWTECFNPTAQLLGQISQWQWLPPMVWPSLTCQTTADHHQYYFPLKFSHWPNSTSDFPPRLSNPPIRRKMGRRLHSCFSGLWAELSRTWGPTLYIDNQPNHFF